jgi:hypothetical protein
MPKISYLLAAVAVASLFCCAAQAGEAVDAATRAEQLASEGKYDEALTAIDAAKTAIWEAAPLTFRRALFVASEPQGFGIYDIRETSTFKKSDPLIIYSEPLGFAYGKDGDIYTIDLAMDFAITDAAGKDVASQKGFGTLRLRSRVPNKEFMAKVTYDFSQLPPGDYEVTTTAHDQNSDKSGSFSLKFTITE